MSELSDRWKHQTKVQISEVCSIPEEILFKENVTVIITSNCKNNFKLLKGVNFRNEVFSYIFKL